MRTCEMFQMVPPESSMELHQLVKVQVHVCNCTNYLKHCLLLQLLCVLSSQHLRME